jgi:hypothetical protein
MNQDEVLVAVGRLYTALQRMSKLDDLFQETWPQVTLGEGAIEEIERLLGQPLPSPMRAYYSKFDRWEGFWLDKCVLSARSLVDGPDFLVASERLGWVDSTDFERAGLKKSDFWVFGLDRHAPDLYLISRLSGEVIWWAGEVVDRFASPAELLHRYAAELEDRARAMRIGDASEPVS